MLVSQCDYQSSTVNQANMKIAPYSILATLLITMSVAPAIEANPAGSGAPTLAELHNATYTGMEGGSVSLLNGGWEGEPYSDSGASRPRAGLVENVYVTGDLDGDGVPEAVVILWRSSGGTGSNTYVVVMARHNDEIRNIGTALIGDRVKLRGGKIVDGTITLEVLQAGENDAMCCPTMLAVRTWSLQGSQLQEGEIEVVGKLSLAALDGSEWALTHLDRGHPISEEIDVTLAFADQRISGKSACNRYSAGIEEGDRAGSIQIGQSMGTMMACPDELMTFERQYLDALSHVTDFSFYGGRLALNGHKEDGSPYSLLFARRLTDKP